MSASFLVGSAGKAWLLGIGTQRMTIRNGRFRYEGGTIPTSCPGALPVVRAGVHAIQGLCGFVGVDFIWDSARRHATILEINPRPTTSCVGLRQLLPAGHLAQAWLGACLFAGQNCELLDGLSMLVHHQAPITFDADGTVVV
jgi:predicted ATP-grasp superfamily ATP-dependent carboligase